MECITVQVHTNMQCNATSKQDNTMCALQVNTYARGKLYEGTAASSGTDQKNNVAVSGRSPAGRGHQGQCVSRGVANRVTEVSGTYKFSLTFCLMPAPYISCAHHPTTTRTRGTTQVIGLNLLSPCVYHMLLRSHRLIQIAQEATYGLRWLGPPIQGNFSCPY